MNRPANAHFVAVGTLLFALHKGHLSVPVRNLLSVLKNVKVRIFSFMNLFENGLK